VPLVDMQNDPEVWHFSCVVSEELRRDGEHALVSPGVVIFRKEIIGVYMLIVCVC
jgi:hypothetical protein